MNRSCVQSAGREASSTRLYISDSSLEPHSGRTPDQETRKLAGHDPADRDEVGLQHARPAHLAEEELLVTGAGSGDPVMGQGALLPLRQVVLHGRATTGEVGGGVATGGEHDGEGEIRADQVED